MPGFYTLIPLMSEEKNYCFELLSCPVFAHMALEAKLAGSLGAFYAGALPDGAERLFGIKPLPEEGLGGLSCGHLLIFLAPAPAISRDTIEKLILDAGDDSCALYANGLPVLMYCRKEEYDRFGVLMSCLRHMQAPGSEQVITHSAMAAQRAQETIRMRIILRHLSRGVLVTDMQSTHISPLCEIGEGSVILPSSLLYGATKVGQNCRIGPFAFLQDAVIKDGAKVNASQVIESEVGERSTVGPFAYIRPGSEVGPEVKIGDFVELKKAKIGRGTKVSHLTYLGDCEFGEGVNVGCGVVTVNYDGKKKHKTTVKDGSFIGCNVNLVAPVTIGESAYIAAGSTITEDVGSEDLAVARAKQVVKVKWVKKRRDEGKL